MTSQNFIMVATQNKSYEFIKNYIDTNKKPLKIKDFMAGMGITKSGAQGRIKSLEKKGLIVRSARGEVSLLHSMPTYLNSKLISRISRN